MNMTLSEILIRQRELAGISKKKLPAKLGYAIAKNLIKLQAELNIIEKQRMSMIERYAEKNENGQLVIKNGSYELGENMDKFNEEYEEYLTTETEVEIMTVSPEILVMLDESRYDVLTSAEILALDFMIV